MMASKISNFVFACVILILVQKSATKPSVPKCDYACKSQDLDTGDFFASGSAISSQFLMPDGSVVTNSKGTSITSDGIKQTFHELKKEADRFVQTGQGGSTFANIPNLAIPALPQISVPVPYFTSGHESYSQSAKDHEFESKILQSLSPSTSSHYGQVQQGEHIHSNTQQLCEICSLNTDNSRLNSENTASYNTIVGNVPASESHSTYHKYENSAQKNSSYHQMQPIVPFSNSVKPNTFTTNFIDFNPANRHVDTGAGSESHFNYQEQGSSQVKSQEHVYGGGPVAHPSKVFVSASGPNAVNSQVYEKQQQSSSFSQTAQNPVVVNPGPILAQQAEAELAKQRQSAVYRSSVVQPIVQSVPIDQHGGSFQSSRAYYSSGSSSSSSSNGAGELSHAVVHQIPQKYSASNGYVSSSSSSSKSSSGSYSQDAPEVYYNGNKVSSSIYDLRGDQQIQGNANAETLCTTCTFVAGAPVKNHYGVATSYSSQSSTINGKTTENREAAVAVNDNGKIDQYHVKT